MAKVGKLTKIKSAIKRWPSLTKLSRNNSSVSATKEGGSASSSSSKEQEQQQQLHAVYVGKSRRRYLVNSEVIDHPVFQELVDKSSSSGCDDGVVVSCEVVLFEHLLWMLEGNETQLGSMDELVEFYSCAC
ncbi:auxin-responsive protein SAUR78 [Gastrolobium bilobum]|uniref:auxin-responsive protein SAUR78 n=1 Tax=Gastrolobium bilobum TaxID=150636 RepID=UPI002AAF8D19|nr:auxin-responsive protein SAUR78 [Gastrolobium bilobum]